MSSRRVRPWPPDDPDDVPWPPDERPDRLPILRIDNTQPLWRLHWEDDPNDPPRYPTGRWRFDSPDGSYAVTYVNLSRDHVFVEVYGDVDEDQVIDSQADRQLSFVELKRPLQLVDLPDSGTMRDLKVDSRLSSTTDYERTMAWSAALHAWLPLADGVRYLGRKAGREDNFCLFLDRCGEALEWTPCGSLADNEGLVLRVGERFHMTFDFTLDSWPSDIPDWP